MFFKTSLSQAKIAVMLLGALSELLWAKPSNELVYTEPFDLAAGGTTLTRASQEGIVFANPALLPLGGAWIRWVGLQTGFILDRSLAESAQQNKLTSVGNSGSEDYIDQFFSRSFHLGQTTTLSFLNKNFAISAFNRIELDVAGDRFGDYGLPSVNFGVEAYAGVLTSYALRPFRWLSLGVTAKRLYASEPTIKVPITDQQKIEQLASNTEQLKSEISPSTGTGTDFGALFLWQGHTVDLNLAVKVEDLGTTRFSGDLESFPQSYHLGLGLAIHGTKEVLHLSLDYRDVTNSYEEKLFKKIYLGARLMVRSMIGVACGFYQGIPTLGLRADLLLFKLGVTVYGRELGSYPGDKQRNMVMVYTSVGF